MKFVFETSLFIYLYIRHHFLLFFLLNVTATIILVRAAWNNANDTYMYIYNNKRIELAISRKKEKCTSKQVRTLEHDEKSVFRLVSTAARIPVNPIDR